MANQLMREKKLNYNNFSEWLCAMVDFKEFMSNSARRANSIGNQLTLF